MSKKIFLIWNGPQTEVAYFINGLKKEGHRVVYYIGNAKNHSEEPDLSGVIYHEDYEARYGRPAEHFKNNNFPPPEKDLLEKLYKTESLILTMMNRKVDTPQNPMTVDEKKHLYFDLVRYWQGVLNDLKPDIIILPAVPHNVSNLVIYSLAKILGIKTILFQETWSSDRILMQYSYDNTGPLLTRALINVKDKEYSIDELDEDLKEYYLLQTTPGRDATPIDVKELLEEEKDKTFWLRLGRRSSLALRSLLDLSLFSRVYKLIKRQFESNLKRDYEKLQTLPDLSKNFIYVPLHWQPECTTSPLGELYADQLLLLETLGDSIPKDWKVYVKEHPFQWSVEGVYEYTPMRYKNYYERMARLPGVSLVPVTFDTYELERKSKAVATITGRAAIEGIYRGTPALIFGYPWYMDMPGLFLIKGVDSCKEAMQKIKNGYKPNEKDLLRYLKAFGDSTIRGYLDPYAEDNSTYTAKETIDHILQFLLAELRG